MRSRLGLIALSVASSALVLAQGKGDAPQFKAGVELIQLDVSVLDDKRAPVRGLTAADFTVLDNGVPAPIRAFTPVELDTRTRTTDVAWARELEPDVVSNQVGEEEGRLVIILLDRSIPIEQATVVARKIATAAVDALGPNDLAAVVSTNNGAVQNLTADRARLLRAINASDLSAQMSDTAKEIMNLGVPLNPLSDGRCLCGLCVLETITRVAEAVQDTPRRRKLLLFIGSDMVWQSTNSVMAAGTDVGCETRLKDARATTLASVDRANLTIHSVDPQGLSSVGPQTRASTINRVDSGGAFAGAARARQQQMETNAAMTARQNLEVLPDRTGGRLLVGRNNPELEMPAILRESEAYYVLGIERGAEQKPGASHNIEVKVARKGLRVYSQRKYVVPAEQNSSQAGSSSAIEPSALEALDRLIPSARRPLALSVTPFANAGNAKAIVRVNVDARAFARADGAPVPLNVTVLAVDPTGRSVASAQQTSTIVGAASTAGASAPLVDVNIQSHLELPPGDYGVRVAVSDPAANATASVFSDVTVPKFESAPLSLSGVSVEVGSSPSSAATTRRLFRREEQVRILLQIYQGTQRTDPIAPVAMRVQILDAKGAAIRDQSLPFTEAAFTNRRADCVITLPIAKLPAGDYLLKLEASLGQQMSGRALRFAVE